MEAFIGLKLFTIALIPFKLLFSLAMWLLKIVVKAVKALFKFVVGLVKKIVATVKRKKQQHDVMEDLKSGSMSKDELAEHLTKTLEQ